MEKGALQGFVITEPDHETLHGVGSKWMLSGPELPFQETRVYQDRVLAHM